MYHAVKDEIANVGAATISGTTAVTWAPGRPADVRRLILVTTTAVTVADATLTVSVRDVDDGNSTSYGTFVVPFTGSAADDVQYVDLVTTDTDGSTSAIDGSLVYTAGGMIEVNPGQELVVVSDGGATAGVVQVYVEYQDLGFSGSRVEDATELTFTPA